MAAPVTPGESEQTNPILEILGQTINDPPPMTNPELGDEEVQRMETSVQISAVLSQTVNQSGNQPEGSGSDPPVIEASLGLSPNRQQLFVEPYRPGSIRKYRFSTCNY